jgi:hypothetical protein
MNRRQFCCGATAVLVGLAVVGDSSHLDTQTYAEICPKVKTITDCYVRGTYDGWSAPGVPSKDWRAA